MKPRRVLVLNGPNLNLLGKREPNVYGHESLDSIHEGLRALGGDLGAEVDCRQSNHEGVLVDWIQGAEGDFDGILLNAAAYTHHSIAIRDAIGATGVPTVEVHLSNIYAREPFRRKSMIAPVCVGTIAGFRAGSYSLGLRALIDYLEALEEGGAETVVDETIIDDAERE